MLPLSLAEAEPRTRPQRRSLQPTPETVRSAMPASPWSPKGQGARSMRTPQQEELPTRGGAIWQRRALPATRLSSETEEGTEGEDSDDTSHVVELLEPPPPVHISSHWKRQRVKAAVRSGKTHRGMRSEGEAEVTAGELELDEKEEVESEDSDDVVELVCQPECQPTLPGRTAPPRLTAQQRASLRSFVERFDVEHGAHPAPHPLADAAGFERLVLAASGRPIPQHLSSASSVLEALRCLPRSETLEAFPVTPPRRLRCIPEWWKEQSNPMMRVACLLAAHFARHPLARSMLVYYSHRDGEAAERLAQLLSQEPDLLDHFESLVRVMFYGDDTACRTAWEGCTAEELHAQAAATGESVRKLQTLQAEVDGALHPRLRQQYDVSQQQLATEDGSGYRLCLGRSGLSAGGMGCHLLGVADRRTTLGYISGEVVRRRANWSGHHYSLLLSARDGEYIDATRCRCPLAMANTLTRDDLSLRDRTGRRLFRMNCQLGAPAAKADLGLSVVTQTMVANEELFVLYGEAFRFGRNTNEHVRSLLPQPLPLLPTPAPDPL
eukprot:GGOE01044717.1.p1 GENE.GGOE01044717.1~~GGOE01044717.1.p1  ORF type:complete len:552 (-),score=100.85 GGOE01044717.1:124-1779(-)